MGVGRDILVSRPGACRVSISVLVVQYYGVARTYLGFPCAFLDIPTLEHAVEFEATILIDGRKGVESEM